MVHFLRSLIKYFSKIVYLILVNCVHCYTTLHRHVCKPLLLAWLTCSLSVFASLQAVDPDHRVVQPLRCVWLPQTDSAHTVLWQSVRGQVDLIQTGKCTVLNVGFVGGGRNIWLGKCWQLVTDGKVSKNAGKSKTTGTLVTLMDDVQCCVYAIWKCPKCCNWSF